MLRMVALGRKYRLDTLSSVGSYNLSYEQALAANKALLNQLGEGNAHLAWTMALYLEEPDIEALASEAITDGSNDKKIDFIYLDRDSKRVIFAQGYFSNRKVDSAPDNKAADLNTAAAWLVSGDLANVPETLKTIIGECRTAMAEGEVESVELLYVHNLPESVNVTRELQTAAVHLTKSLSDFGIVATGRELGASRIEHLYATQESQIEVNDEIRLPVEPGFMIEGPQWRATVCSVPGEWLHGLYSKYQDKLFSANYRGFLGISRRRRINTGIRQSAESKPRDFWVFNNGITILTLGVSGKNGARVLKGISIINGAQTTGSIGSIDIAKFDLKSVNVLCRVIECSDSSTIADIVRFNNTQNEITTWDQYSNDQEQARIDKEFEIHGYKYIRKRGFRSSGDQIGIEEVAQPLIAFHGRYQDAVYGKNQIFERKPLYANAFEGKKARHILLVYTLSRAIDERRIVLKQKSSSGKIITIEEGQLALLRNLRFKAFLIATIAACLEVIAEKKFDLTAVAFSPEVADSSKNGLVDMVAYWGPIVEQVLSYVSTQMHSSELSEKYSDDEFFPKIVKNVSALLYAGGSAKVHAGFSAMLSDS